MTRDEAKRTIVGCRDVLDILSLLGVIKFDPPKSREQKIHDFLRDSRLVQCGHNDRAAVLPLLLEDHGLKLVER